MSRELEQLKNAIVEASRRDIAGRSAGRSEGGDLVDPMLSPYRSFFSFSYSRTEISSQGRQFSVKMQQTRFEDGKLVTEECEGAIDRAAYDAVMREAQQQFVSQVGNFMRLLFLPFSGGR